MKRCISCLEYKELLEYYKHPKTADGYLTKCKECQRQCSRENQSAEKEKIRYATKPKRRLQIIFRGMKSRCYKVTDNHYKRYGARGIMVEWKSFIDFYNDMQREYIQHYNDHLDKKRNTQIDRIDNNGNYCKSNCRFVTAKENARNSSRYKAQL